MFPPKQVVAPRGEVSADGIIISPHSTSGASDAFYHSSLWMDLGRNSRRKEEKKGFEKCFGAQMASSVLITQLANLAW